MRSLQPPDILWIHWRVYNSIANTSKRGTLLPPSDAYVRSFLYLPYTLNKTILSLVSGPGLNSSPLEAKNPTSHHSETTFHLGGSSGILQDKVRMLGALVLCSPNEHIFCCTLLTLWCACVNE